MSLRAKRHSPVLAGVPPLPPRGRLPRSLQKKIPLYISWPVEDETPFNPKAPPFGLKFSRVGVVRRGRGLNGIGIAVASGRLRRRVAGLGCFSWLWCRSRWQGGLMYRRYPRRQCDDGSLRRRLTGVHPGRGGGLNAAQLVADVVDILDGALTGRLQLSTLRTAAARQPGPAL